MNDEELEKLLRSDRAEVVLDQGFSDHTMVRLPKTMRRKKNKIVLFALALGILTAMLFSSGMSAVLSAMLQLMDGKANLTSAMIVLVPIASAFILGMMLVEEDA
jgi:Ni/Fe-hydrogenase subunit HybB-like protein